VGAASGSLGEEASGGRENIALTLMGETYVLTIYGTLICKSGYLKDFVKFSTYLDRAYAL
jgi:hypothetical protein